MSEPTPYLVVPPSRTAHPGRPRLPALLGAARKLVQTALDDEFSGPPPGPVLLGCSGGTDSLALAVAAAHLHRSGAARIGAVVIDHQLQPDSSGVAHRTATVLHGLGLDPVEIRPVAVSVGSGPEAAARHARYRGFRAALTAHQAAALLLAHTENDSAEQVLLGLARGSGTRSAAGIRPRRVSNGTPVLRPFLSLSRNQTSQLCRLGGVVPWQDPSNADSSLLRNRVRTRVLPYLEAELDPRIIPALARSGRIFGQDADALDEIAETEFARLATVTGQKTTVNWHELAQLPAAVRHRVLRLAVTALGAPAPTFERLEALAALGRNRGSTGPVQLPGGVRGYRQNRAQRQAESPHRPGCGNIVVQRD